VRARTYDAGDHPLDLSPEATRTERMPGGEWSSRDVSQGASHNGYP
jgi:hypothetical protein